MLQCCTRLLVYAKNYVWFWLKSAGYEINENTSDI